MCVYVRHGDYALRELCGPLMQTGTIDGVDLLRASCAQPFGFARLSAIPGYEFLERFAGFTKKDKFKLSSNRTAAILFTDGDRLETLMTILRREGGGTLSAYALPVLDAIIGSEP